MRAFMLVVATSTVMGAAGCDRGTTCTDWAGGYGERSSVGWGQCSDGSERAIECERTPSGTHQCKCMKDGAVGKTFEHADGVLGTKEKSSKLANEMCGWELVP